MLSALFGPEDQVFSDELNHASLIDGLRLSGAQRKIYPHGNLQRLREFLQESTRRGGGLKAIVTESLFSMDGDLARLQELADLAEEYSALLIVDEAHATGLWGDPSKNSGGGLVQKLGLTNRVFATLHTGGKSLGVGGAWVCGSAQLKEYLINFCRAFVFSTAPSPVVVFLVSAALQRWKEVGIERAEKVLETSIALQNLLKQEVACFSHHSAVQGPVIPLVIGDNLATLQIAEHVRKQGYDVRAIRPPTVPEGKARLRLTLHWQNTDEEIRGLVKAMKEATRDWRQNL